MWYMRMSTKITNSGWCLLVIFIKPIQIYTLAEIFINKESLIANENKNKLPVATYSNIYLNNRIDVSVMDFCYPQSIIHQTKSLN